jgi:hypothetical protein
VRGGGRQSFSKELRTRQTFSRSLDVVGGESGRELNKIVKVVFSNGAGEIEAIFCNRAIEGFLWKSQIPVMPR